MPQSLTKLMRAHRQLSRVSILRRLFELREALGAREGRADASLSLVSMVTDVLIRGWGGLVYWLSYCTPAVSPTKRAAKRPAVLRTLEA